MEPPPLFDGELCDSPNFLLLVDGYAGQFELRHGGLFSSYDPDAMGHALQLAISQRFYSEAITALYGAGWTTHIPFGSSLAAVSLPSVVRNEDIWVAVGYAPTWRPTNHRSSRQPPVTVLPSPSPFIRSGIGKATITKPSTTLPAAAIAEYASSYYHMLRIHKLV